RGQERSGPRRIARDSCACAHDFRLERHFVAGVACAHLRAPGPPPSRNAARDAAWKLTPRGPPSSSTERSPVKRRYLLLPVVAGAVIAGSVLASASSGVSAHGFKRLDVKGVDPQLEPAALDPTRKVNVVVELGGAASRSARASPGVRGTGCPRPSAHRSAARSPRRRRASRQRPRVPAPA